MKRSTLSIALAALILAVGGFLIFWFLVRPLLAPPPPPVKPPPPALKGALNSVVDLYLAGPAAVAGKTDRVELTLIGVTAVAADGTAVEVSSGTVKVVVRKDMVEKVFSGRVPSGIEQTLRLKFAPVARYVSSDGSVIEAFLPQTVLKVLPETAIPTSRTLAAMFRLELDGRAGVRSGLPTYELPASVTAETYVLGGFLPNDLSLGQVISSPPTLHDVVLTDLGLDITPHPEQTGSSGFLPASGAPKPQKPQ